MAYKCVITQQDAADGVNKADVKFMLDILKSDEFDFLIFEKGDYQFVGFIDTKIFFEEFNFERDTLETEILNLLETNQSAPVIRSQKFNLELFVVRKFYAGSWL